MRTANRGLSNSESVFVPKGQGRTAQGTAFQVPWVSPTHPILPCKGSANLHFLLFPYREHILLES